MISINEGSREGGDCAGGGEIAQRKTIHSVASIPLEHAQVDIGVVFVGIIGIRY